MPSRCSRCPKFSTSVWFVSEWVKVLQCYSSQCWIPCDGVVLTASIRSSWCSNTRHHSRLIVDPRWVRWQKIDHSACEREFCNFRHEIKKSTYSRKNDVIKILGKLDYSVVPVTHSMSWIFSYQMWIICPSYILDISSFWYSRIISFQISSIR